jgi:hypothetical protein
VLIAAPQVLDWNDQDGGATLVTSAVCGVPASAQSAGEGPHRGQPAVEFVDTLHALAVNDSRSTGAEPCPLHCRQRTTAQDHPHHRRKRMGGRGPGHVVDDRGNSGSSCVGWRIAQNCVAPVRVRRLPNIFCRSLIMRMSRSERSPGGDSRPTADDESCSRPDRHRSRGMRTPHHAYDQHPGGMGQIL